MASTRPTKLARALQEPLAAEPRLWYHDPGDAVYQVTDADIAIEPRSVREIVIACHVRGVLGYGRV
jgi:hypothetical protein